MQFKELKIKGVYAADLVKYADERGWLSELWRTDDTEKVVGPIPEMCYVSKTQPGVARGPHEHREQSDYFAFLGPGNFKLLLWDARKDSPTHGQFIKVFVGEDNPKVVTVPPGVVHGYKCVSDHSGFVINFADRLFMGKDRKEPVDEVRHELDPHSPYSMEA
jgi:dTDP-4-dehydrorhamnose 3,5-epimerase